MDLLNELESHIKSIENYCDLCADSESSENLKIDLKELFNNWLFKTFKTTTYLVTEQQYILADSN